MSIFFKMMNFICIKPSLLELFLYFECLWKQVQKTKCLYKYLKLAQELRKLVIVKKKTNEFSILVANSK